MAGRTLTLRLKAKDGQHVLNQLTLENTIEDLKSIVSDLTKIPSKALKFLRGFPPKMLDVSDNKQTLSHLHLKSGDTLIVEEDKSKNLLESKSDQLLQEVQTQFQSGQGILTRYVVPANNSCLFTSFNFVTEGGILNLESAKGLRQLISKVVGSDRTTYNAGFLGKSNKDYCKWIVNDDSWGGAIELAILSSYYSVEIDVVDTQTGRIDRFGEDKFYPNRVLVIYDGVHYDPLVLEPADPSLTRETVFSTKDDFILSQALELAAEAKASRQFTDVANFTLRCLICRLALRGQQEAQAHAKETGHINFGEV